MHASGDERLELFAVGGGRLWHKWRTAASNGVVRLDIARASIAITGIGSGSLISAGPQKRASLAAEPARIKRRTFSAELLPKLLPT
jgi:hypothetical protein